jgi:hypothetical protein
VPVSALARLLDTLGAGAAGDAHVVVTDVREELVVYINGMPYIRRELEMPAAAMHHAGVLFLEPSLPPLLSLYHQSWQSSCKGKLAAVGALLA